MRILYIDAWRNRDGWDWNDWRKVGEIDRDVFETLDNNRKLLKWLRENSILSENSAGNVRVEDDGHNLVICNRHNNRPLIAIEYAVEFC